MLLKNLLEVVPSSTVLHVDNQRDETVFTKTAGGYLLNEKDIYNRKVVLVTINGETLNVTTE